MQSYVSFNTNFWSFKASVTAQQSVVISFHHPISQPINPQPLDLHSTSSRRHSVSKASTRWFLHYTCKQCSLLSMMEIQQVSQCVPRFPTDVKGSKKCWDENKAVPAHHLPKEGRPKQHLLQQLFAAGSSPGRSYKELASYCKSQQPILNVSVIYTVNVT